ncbi:MAG: hypothetical protein MUQ65_09365, partial [Armatimonadetes bacterium]|nr:hypothetical protein [Armatimonadota bacterium]
AARRGSAGRSFLAWGRRGYSISKMQTRPGVRVALAVAALSARAHLLAVPSRPAARLSGERGRSSLDRILSL